MATGTLSAAADTVTLSATTGQGALTCTLSGTYAGAVVAFETTTGGVAPITAINSVGGGSASQWTLGTNSSNVFTFGPGVPAGIAVRVRLVSITSGSVSVVLVNAPTSTYQAIAQAATVTPNVASGNFIIVSITTTNDITITNPSGGVTGNQIDVIVQNATTTMGTITWGPQFVLAGAFTNPVTMKSRTITFRNTGTSWVEFARAATDLTF